MREGGTSVSSSNSSSSISKSRSRKERSGVSVRKTSLGLRFPKVNNPNSTLLLEARVVT